MRENNGSWEEKNEFTRQEVLYNKKKHINESNEIIMYLP